MPYEVPPLPYDYNALEPHIDEQTMQLHHDKHHQAYVDNANKALAGTEWEDRPVEGVLAEPGDPAGGRSGPPFATTSAATRTTRLFWEIMSPDGGGEPSGSLADAINDTFDSVDELKKLMNDTGVKRFGSGWSWLVCDGTGLAVYSTANQDSPISNSRRAAPRHRRLGARLLLQVPEPQARVSRDLVERRQLGRRAEEVTRARTSSPRSRRCFGRLPLDDRLRSAPGIDVAGRHLGRRHVDPDRPAPARDHRADELHPHDPAGLLPKLQPADVDPRAGQREALQVDEAARERLAGRDVEVEIARPRDEAAA